MSDEQENQPKPTTKFAPMQKQREVVESQWGTIGGGKENSTMPTDTLTQKRNDVKTSKQQDTIEMKRQTVYMPKWLATRLKIHAASTGDDISGIITRLVEDYLDRVERE
jgi:hypothetical protein